VTSGSTSQPVRQPVMHQYLEKLLTITASLEDARAVVGAVP
jgi:hypothetical protein